MTGESAAREAVGGRELMGYKRDMATSADEIRDRLLSLFERGGRYQTEKLTVVGTYVAICIATAVWVFTVDDAENELGASHGFETLRPLNQQIFFLENESGDDWTDVRIVLNREYLFKTDTIEDGERLMLRPEDFRYFYWVPRPWGRNDWEALADQPKPPELATDSVKWELVQVRAREGRLDLELE
jgi:hypothetical protein